MGRGEGLIIGYISSTSTPSPNCSLLPDPVMSNMDVATSSCEGLGSDSCVLSEVLEENLKLHMRNSKSVQTYPVPMHMRNARCAFADTSTVGV
jgi:hypothetical protein